MTVWIIVLSLWVGAGKPPTVPAAVSAEVSPWEKQPFNRIFELRLDEPIRAAWSDADVAAFMDAVIDVDSTSSEQTDVFPRVWEYVAFGDEDPSYGGIRLPDGRTRIVLELEDSRRPDSRCVFQPNGPTVVVKIDSTLPPAEALRRSCFAHELTHLISDLVNDARKPRWADEGTAETGSLLSKGYFAGNGQVNRNTYYNGSARAALPYRHFSPILAYLYTHYAGEPDPGDDLLSAWHAERNLSFHGLARAVERLAGTYPDLPGARDGATADRIVGNLYHRVAVAKLLDERAPGARYGFGGHLSTRDQLAYFNWVDTNGLRVRCIPPLYTASAGAGVWHATYTDPVQRDRPDERRGQCPRAARILGLRSWSADYLVVNADGGGPPRDLQLDLDFGGPRDEERLRVGWVTFPEPVQVIADSLALPPGYTVTEAAGSWSAERGTWRGRVPGFGGEVRGVVLVLTRVSEPIPEWMGGCRDGSTDCFQELGGCSQPDWPYRFRIGGAAGD